MSPAPAPSMQECPQTPWDSDSLSKGLIIPNVCGPQLGQINQSFFLFLFAVAMLSQLFCNNKCNSCLEAQILEQGCGTVTLLPEGVSDMPLLHCNSPCRWASQRCPQLPIQLNEPELQIGALRLVAPSDFDCLQIPANSST